MCELAARCARCERPALQREDRLAARDPAGDPCELARVAERLEVEQDDLGRRVVLPPLEQVVRRDVRLVADRDERGETEAARRRRLEQREPERAALRREADVAGRNRVRRERRVRGAGRRRRSRGSSGRSGAHRARGRARAARCWRAAPVLARLREAGRDDAQRPHAAAPAPASAASSTTAAGTQMTARSISSGISSTVR